MQEKGLAVLAFPKDSVVFASSLSDRSQDHNNPNNPNNPKNPKPVSGRRPHRLHHKRKKKYPPGGALMRPDGRGRPGLRGLPGGPRGRRPRGEREGSTFGSSCAPKLFRTLMCARMAVSEVHSDDPQATTRITPGFSQGLHCVLPSDIDGVQNPKQPFDSASFATPSDKVL